MAEFLVDFHISFPPEAPQPMIDRLYREEAETAKPMMERGEFVRVWRVPGTRDHIALWNVPDAETIHERYSSFPMWKAGYGIVTRVQPLALNPNDPGPNGDAGLLKTTAPENYHGPKLTWVSLNNWLQTMGEPGDASHGEGLSAQIHPGVSIHNHPQSDRPAQIHVMVDGVKIAEIGPPDNQGEKVEPSYVDLMVEWLGKPVGHPDWKLRILQDNNLPDTLTHSHVSVSHGGDVH